MRTRWIAAAVAALLVLATPASTVGWTKGQAPQIDTAQTTCTYNPAAGTSSILIFYDDSAGKPTSMGAFGLEARVSGRLLKDPAIGWGVWGVYTSTSVYLANHYGTSSTTVTCTSAPA